MHYQGVPTPAQQVIPNGHNLFKIVVLFGLLFGAFVLARLGEGLLQQALPLAGWMVTLLAWKWILFCGIIASIAAQGLGILAHDAVHRVMLRPLWLNEWVGGLIAAFALIPFHANRRFHLAHHRFSHQRDRDPEQPMHNHPLWFAITFGSVIALGLQYLYLWQNLVSRQQWLTAFKDLGFLSIAMACYFILLPSFGLELRYTLVPLLLTLPLVFGMRAISDHYGLPEVVRDKQEQDKERSDTHLHREVGGWVILTSPVLEWLWSHVNYHEVHHKFPYLSHRYLKQTLAATRHQLPYVIADGYLRNLWRHRQRAYYHPRLPESD